MKAFFVFLALAALSTAAGAQTIDDGIMMTARSIQTGDVYTRDAWDQYWEGALKRTNGNIGTITTHTNAWTVAYGLTDRLTAIGSIPYVWTRPSMGVLQGQSGLQDITAGVKYAFVERGSARSGVLRVIGAVSGSFPLTTYTPDFAPLSIGTQSSRVSPRATVNYQTGVGLYLNGSTSYTSRADVLLDRPYYFTDDQFFLTDQVTMPNVADYVVSVGYLKHDLNANVSYSQQSTRGGGDIRRQDMPFVSNRVDFSRVGAMAMYPIPWMNEVMFQVAVAHVLDGRNVGQSTSFTIGFLYSRAAQRRLIR